ncbi:penicillin-binding protein 1A [Brachymonas wangyanguii]|uniref:penicillin-binding protein 1A n=1 Tax=Brachymonas wangyanguii TaxID=3130163 RepID=UPI00307F0662
MSQSNDSSQTPAQPPRQKRHWLVRLFLWLIGLIVAGAATVALLAAVALSVAYPNLPDVSSLQNYQPKLPLRIYSSEGNLINEFGEERRSYVPFDEIPAIMKNAVLAIEDARFYEHNGIDYVGVMRAGMANFSKARSQGASTITMQVARNVYLSSEKTFTRKIYEMMLAFKLERNLSKDQILEIYMNQIFLGNRAYGFAAASEAYFGKPLQQINLAEAAMLAGLPKAPSLYNPIVNPSRARIRQVYILDRMVETGFITPQQAEAAKNTELVLQRATYGENVHAEYVGEMVRQLIYDQYGADTYTRGLNVYTTISTEEQHAAYKAVRTGILNYDARRSYRGPEHFITLPTDPDLVEEAISDALVEYPDAGEMKAAVVTEASPRKVVVRRSDNEDISITGNGLRFVSFSLSNKANDKQKIRPGAIVRVVENKGAWSIRQLPEVEASLVSLDPQTGAIKALVGGFDFNKSKFNHVTQAFRQPGSSFKPFIYSAGLEEGIMPSTLVSDSELVFDSSVTGGKPWSPKNYDGRFGPPLTVRQALAKSRNMISIRILQSVGTQKTQDWVGRFGFPADRTPPYLTMALGANTTTPLEMAVGMSVFANGGHAVSPYVISLIKDQRGNVLSEVQPAELTEQRRVIPARNAFIMNSLMNEVTTTGTAAKASAQLGRRDLFGKTGTTNDSKDAWFAGFQPTRTAVVWMGFDNPRNLGDRETGGGLSLPIWIDYMKVALKGVPLAKTPNPPEGVTREGDWVYTEYAGGRGIARIGVASNYSSTAPARRSGGSTSPAAGTDTAPAPADNVGAHSTGPFGGN